MSGIVPFANLKKSSQLRQMNQNIGITAAYLVIPEFAIDCYFKKNQHVLHTYYVFDSPSKSR